MQSLGQSNLNYDFEAFNAAGQVAHKDTLVYEDYDVARYLLYRIPATKLGNADDASIEAWFEADDVPNAARWQMLERGASLALSYIVATGPDIKEVKAKTDLLGTVRSLVRW